MSRLVTEVFDFDELALTATQLAIDITEATPRARDHTHGRPGPGGSKEGTANPNCSSIPCATSPWMKSKIYSSKRLPLRHSCATCSAGVVQDCSADAPAAKKRLVRIALRFAGVIPLSSHGKRIGLLGIAHKNTYEFEREGTNVLLAFSILLP